MTDKELRHLSRDQLLELLLEQSREIDSLREELEKAKEETRKTKEDRRLDVEKAGSIAEAALAITNVFEDAQKAADLYLENTKRSIDALKDAGEALPETLGTVKAPEPSAAAVTPGAPTVKADTPAAKSVTPAAKTVTPAAKPAVNKKPAAKKSAKKGVFLFGSGRKNK